MTGDRQDRRPGGPVRVFLCGAPGSGRSTLVAALPVAAMQAGGDGGAWSISGVDEPSARVIVGGVEQLTVRRRFPSSMSSPGVGPMAWSVQGRGIPAGTGAWWLRRKDPQDVDVAVEFRDVAVDVDVDVGGDGAAPSGPVPDAASADGLLCLVDPRPGRRADGVGSVGSVLGEAHARAERAGRTERGRLPHHVAVLVTKFDDPAFFQEALEAGWVSQEVGGGRLPYVPIRSGRDFFDWLCSVRDADGPARVREALHRHLLRERVEYFACSAIGFRLNANQVFDYRDFRNVDAAGTSPPIRSQVRPVNVLEPVMRLERRIRRAKGAR